MNDEYELYKCKILIKMLIKRHENIQRALEIYPKKIYEEALKELKNKEILN